MQVSVYINDFFVQSTIFDIITNFKTVLVKK